MNKRVIVRVLVLAVLLMAAVVPFSVSAQPPATAYIYLHGQVWDDTNDIGVIGATVQLWRMDPPHVEMLRESDTVSVNGDWGWGIDLRDGAWYTVKVSALPAGYTSDSVRLWDEVWFRTLYADGVGEFELPINLMGMTDFWNQMIVFGCTNETVIPEEPVELPDAMYVFGTVWDTAGNAAAPNTDKVENAKLFLQRRELIAEWWDPVNLVTQQLWTPWVNIDERSSGDRGYYGLACPVRDPDDATSEYRVQLFQYWGAGTLVTPAYSDVFGAQETAGPFDFDVA